MIKWLLLLLQNVPGASHKKLITLYGVSLALKRLLIIIPKHGKSSGERSKIHPKTKKSPEKNQRKLPKNGLFMRLLP